MTSRHKNQSINRSFGGPALILSGYAVLMVYWFKHYLSTAEIPSVDLNGHIAIIDALTRQLPWRIVFYDRGSFTGWPVFQFYAFLTHLAGALLAIALSPFVSDAPRLAAHLILIACAAALPASIYYCARPIVVELAAAAGQTAEASVRPLLILLAYASGAFGFWFLNHDGQWHGIGAASMMNVGLFSHGAGLILLLINLGDLFRLLTAPRPAVVCSPAVGRLAATFALLFLAHSLSALLMLGAAVFALIWYPAERKQVAAGYGLGLALTAFWTVPHLAFSGEYVGLDIIKNEGDFVALFLRYPLWWLLRGLSHFSSFHLLKIDPANLVLPALIILMLIDRRVRVSRLIIPFFCFVLAAVVIVSGTFAPHSIPLGLHYYRFIGYIFLILTTLLTAVSVVPAIGIFEASANGGSGFKRRLIWLTLISFGITAAQIFLPHYERGRIIAETNSARHADEEKVLDYFRSQQIKGRVLLQYFNDYKKYPWLDAHYLAAHLFERSGFEPLNGVFIQSTLAFQFPISSLLMLGVGTYNIPVLFTQGATLQDNDKIAQLRSFGITHLVVGDDKAERFRPLARGNILSFGPFRVVPIADQPFRELEPLSSRQPLQKIIGYRDLTGDLPFRYLEFYFYSRRDLYSQYILVDLENLNRLPAVLDAVMLNTNSADLKSEPYVRRIFASAAEPGGLDFKIPVIKLQYLEKFRLDHYSVWYQDNYQLDSYQAIAAALDRYSPLRRSLNSLTAAGSAAAVTAAADPAPAKVNWSADGQSVDVSGLVPGLPYLFNHSYFPYWRSEDGELLRASSERILLVPKEGAMHLTFSRSPFFSTWLGNFVSAAALIWLLYCRRRNSGPAKTAAADG